ncbi:hypothetical protein F0M18_13645 [Pseudohalioglobus sediminis]|uniref:Uncharacterized protein n=1 Tax=Pseudohalioglobus sediminis TaxID=2606449 RepID=A0A5B0WSV2_9GAMM|nr:hypothetical protein [Pseudohalioglobus sediminis]KAA1190104.1 hypothetical protein F0M18_13645 [Pseudohalioglobus sediminis]
MNKRVRTRVLHLMAFASGSALAMAFFISQCWFLLSDYVGTRAIDCVWRYEDSWYDNCSFYYSEASSWFIIGRIIDETWFWLYVMGGLGSTLTVAFSLFLLAGEALRRSKIFLRHDKR